MKPELARLIDRQRDTVQQMKEEATDIAETVADEVWDQFETEIDSLIGDEFMFDVAPTIVTALSASLGTLFDEAITRHVEKPFLRLEEALLRERGGGNGFDSGHLDLDTLRKTVKLSRRINTQIEAAIERARPGVGRALSTIIGDWLDSDGALDRLDRDMVEDANRVKAELAKLRKPITEEVREAATLIVKRAARDYLAWLDAIEAEQNP
ncbi:MAG TPA: hypothetical protein PKI22_09135 [Hydrogenophilus thermoluteolus]|nr:hypothetical protein [Hydrogenophilus thermoluteolus]